MPAALVVRDEGGVQHMGEKGKMGRLRCVSWMGVDGDSPLSIYPPVALGESEYLDWALLCVKDICPVVGISCVGMSRQLWLS